MKNKVLWMITNVNVMSLFLMVIMVDSETWIPFIILCVNMAWLVMFALVNFDYFERKYHGE